MTPNLTSSAKSAAVKVVIVTLDCHIAGAVDQARATLRDELPNLDLRLHVAASFNDESSAEACRKDIGDADIVFANMLFMDAHIQAVLPALQARRENCDAMVCTMSSGEVMKQTRMGTFRMDGEAKGAMKLLKKLRGKPKAGGKAPDGGASQMAMLRRLPKILRFLPGRAQDLRAYFLTLSYWLSGSTDNMADLVRMLVTRYAAGPREGLKGTLEAKPPREYPSNGLYHPALTPNIVESTALLPTRNEARGRIGLLIMRSYVLAGDAGHYDAVIADLEARGYDVVPAFASGLDSRPAIKSFFMRKDKVMVDAVVSLTGFSLVGGPAFNDANAAEEMLAKLDVPYIAAHALEFTTIDEWKSSNQGMSPIESTLMVAIPELDGATGPIVFGGRQAVEGGAVEPQMVGLPERVAQLGARVDRLVTLRKKAKCDRRVGVVLFNFPPNSGATGTAAYLSVFESLHNTLRAMKDDGYTVDVPESVEALRERLLEGNAASYGADANVHAHIAIDDHVRAEPHLDEIEAHWGPAPGKHQTDGASIFVFGAQFGNVFVGVQPAFGYEGDPMRLLFEHSFAPTHAFAAFYRYLREKTDAVLHFGTHGALEFMPGKQTGMSGDCWPDRLIGDLPNFYLYAANNPSEGALARRRSAATLISYLTPPVAPSGLYRGLLTLRESVDRLRSLAPSDAEAERLLPLVQTQATELELIGRESPWRLDDPATAHRLHKLQQDIVEVEQTLVPYGLHVIGKPMAQPARTEMLRILTDGSPIAGTSAESIETVVDGYHPREALYVSGLEQNDQTLKAFTELCEINTHLTEDRELPALLHALDGGFIRPAPGGDLLRNPAVLPTGRNVHGFDPFGIPSAFAIQDGAEQANRLLTRHVAEGHELPESVALVLWATDNLKSGGGPIGQALALMGARPRLDSYGRLCGASLIPLDELGRPRIDVFMTLSGIFRDLLPLQTRLLAEAAFLAASAEESIDDNFVRRNSLAHQARHGCDLETAALRVFSNADGAYGANVNQLVDSGAWEDEDELGEAYTKRKCFAYGRDGVPVRREELLKSVLAGVSLAYQNLESVELGVTTVDHYFDTLGGIGRAARKERGTDEALPVYIGDQTQGEGKVRTLTEQVSLETRSRSLNPRWAEEMLKHGSEGVRQIESQVTNTLGWSATTSLVQPWVYRELTEMYVLDEEMRERLARLNPKAAVRLANRLVEATERNYWQPDEATLEALRRAGEELEDSLEGLGVAA